MEKTKVEMLKTTRGSQDGCLVETFKAGEVYDMEADLARVFVEEMKVAVKHPRFEVPERPVFETPENGMKRITLKDKPKKWGGLKIRPTSGGDTVTVIETTSNKVVLSDGSTVDYRHIRNKWEMV